MSWIDSHCHLYPFYKKGKIDEILMRASSASVNQMITVGTTYDDWIVYRELVKQHPVTLNYSVGLHPCYVTKNWRQQTEHILKFWQKVPRPCALGEIGLDYFHLPSDFQKSREIISLQKHCLLFQLKIAKELDCPVIIHSRDAFFDCIELIEESGVDWEKVVFHCFSEGEAEMEQLLKLGGTASFTGIITYKNNDKMISSIKLLGEENVMLETDSPYLPPEPFRKSQNEPSMIPVIGKKVSEILDVSEDLLAQNSKSKTSKFFNL